MNLDNSKIEATISNIDNVEQKQISKVELDPISEYSGMTKVFEATKAVIDGMAQHERLTIEDLTDIVKAKVEDLNIGNVGSMVKLCIAQSKLVKVEPGRNGGVYKGGRKPRVDTRPRCKTCSQVLRNITNAADSSESDI